MAVIEYRRAFSQDYLAIVQLNSTNFIGNLAEEDRKDGFLSAVFTLEQTAAMAEDLGTMVSIVDGVLVGFLCAFQRVRSWLAGGSQDDRIVRPNAIRR